MIPVLWYYGSSVFLPTYWIRRYRGSSNMWQKDRLAIISKDRDHVLYTYPKESTFRLDLQFFANSKLKSWRCKFCHFYKVCNGITVIGESSTKWPSTTGGFSRHFVLMLLQLVLSSLEEINMSCSVPFWAYERFLEDPVCLACTNMFFFFWFKGAVVSSLVNISDIEENYLQAELGHSKTISLLASAPFNWYLHEESLEVWCGLDGKRPIKEG